jgi:hypothetical protein
MAMLGKRAGELDKLLYTYKDYLAKQGESSASRPLSSPPPSGPDHEWTVVEKPPPSIPEKPSTMSDADYELVGAHGLPNPGPSTESGHESTEVHAPLSTQVFPTWFDSDRADDGSMRAHASPPNLVPSNPRPSTESDSDHRLVADEPPSRPASPTEFAGDQENPVVHPPSSLPKDFDDDMYEPDRRSMSLGADSRSENPQAISDALKGNAKESRRISGTARDVLNVAQRELQRERSLDPGE